MREELEHEEEGAPPEPLIQLVYASAATRQLSTEDLDEILDAARRNNGAAGITGMLLYHEGSFLQVLEGDPEVVDALFERIEGDPRHTDAMVLLRAEVEERGFERWRMGFYRATAEEVRKTPGMSEFLRTGVARTVDATQGAAALKLLLAFREGRWRRTVETG